VNEILIIAGMALVTLAVRYPLLVLLGRIPRPEPIFRALKYVPPAVLTAIIVPAVLYKDERLVISPTNDYLVAGIISVVVAWRSKNLLLTIIIGMAVFLGWRWALSTHLLGL
jgi:branched-subunit amino acid transport protein